VDGVHNINPLQELVQRAGDDFKLKVFQGTQVKIQPKSSANYSTIVKALTEFHTYQPKAERSFRTILRGLHSSTDTKEMSETESLGHTVVNIFNIKQSRANIPLPLFFVDLNQSPNNKPIYLIDTLLSTKVTFEPPRLKQTIPQCTKCQRYGHKQAYCFHSPRCVKCAGNHHTAQCLRKAKSDDVTCVVCNGKHPANYNGCPIY
jgi:PAX-interacting protein 1